MEEPGRQDAVQMRMMLYSQLTSRALSVVVRLGVAEALAERPRTVAEIAGEVAAHPQALYRLLRGLVPFGAFTEVDTHRFALTPLGRSLLADTPASAQPTALLLANEVGATWAELAHTIKTGESAFAKIHGTDLFDHLERNPGTREIFDRSQAAGLSLELAEIFDSIDFSGYRKIVDVGGGDGMLLCSLLRREPDSVGLIVDLPGTVPTAVKRITEEDLAHRCSAVDGDFFDSVPGGGDLYILSHVLHDWDDNSAVAILRTCREAMPEHARIMVIDLVIDGPQPAGDAHHLPALMDLYMLSLFGVSGGQERSRPGFTELVRRAGLAVTDFEALGSGMAVITAARQPAGQEGHSADTERPHSMRVVADRERCAGSGVCAESLPGVFDQDDDAVVRPLMTAVPERLREQVAEVVRKCPTGALSLVLDQ